MSISLDGPVDPEVFLPWINEVVQRDGIDILRSKGILAFPDKPKRYRLPGRAHDPGRRSATRLEA